MITRAADGTAIARTGTSLSSSFLSLESVDSKSEEWGSE